MHFTLPAHKEICVQENSSPNSQVVGSYVVSGKADHNVKTTVIDPDSRIVYQSPYRAREGSFLLKADRDGSYKVCFKSMDGASKTLSFEFEIQHPDFKKFATSEGEQLEYLEHDLLALQRNLNTVMSNIKFYQRREAVNRDLVETACKRIILGVIAKVLIFISVAIVQLYIAKHYFDTKPIRI